MALTGFPGIGRATFPSRRIDVKPLGAEHLPRNRMSHFRRVTDRISVSPQIALEDVADAAQQGFGLVINNRPDGEAADQPPGKAVEAAAAEAGLAYAHIPVHGGPTREQAEAMRKLVDEAAGPTLAYCRSGTRSIVTWALGQALAGAPREELVAAGRAAGYDLDAVLPR
jgi:uncharacterized protein (TIGR01244 family)